MGGVFCYSSYTTRRRIGTSATPVFSLILPAAGAFAKAVATVAEGECESPRSPVSHLPRGFKRSNTRSRQTPSRLTAFCQPDHGPTMTAISMNLPTDGTFLGRARASGTRHPLVVTVRDGEVVDITSDDAPTVRDVCEMADPVGYVGSAKGRADRRARRRSPPTASRPAATARNRICSRRSTCRRSRRPASPSSSACSSASSRSRRAARPKRRTPSAPTSPA